MTWAADSARDQFAGRDLHWLLGTRAASCPDRTCLIWEPFDGEGQELTYGQLLVEVESLAAGLQRRGTGSRDRVILHMDNCMDFVISWLACSLVGAVVVTTNTRAAEAEIAYFLDHAGATAAITEPRHADVLAAAGSGLSWLAISDRNADGSGAEEGAGNRAGDPLVDLRVDRTEFVPPPIDSRRDLAVQYTSGSTGPPKGVVWTQANALWAARTGAAHEALGPSDRHLIHLPLFHTNALAYSLLPSLWVGASVVLMPRFSASRFWDVAVRNRCTWTTMVPFTRRALMNRSTPTHHFRHWGDGVCALPSDESLGVRTLGWWGMTETISHGIVGDMHIDNPPMTMGWPAAEYGIAVLGDDERPAGLGEAGRLWISGERGVSLFDRYLDDPGATAAAFRGSWFDTGDLVRRNEDGSLSFISRADDLLKVGGENVSPMEIEIVLSAVDGVNEAAVVAAPDPMLGQVPIAFVVPEPDAPEGLDGQILKEASARLASFKVPRRVHLIETMPHTGVGKVAKAALGELIDGSDSEGPTS